MRKVFSVLLIFLSVMAIAQDKGKKVYSKGGIRIDPSLIDEQVGDSVKKVSAVFHFKNDLRDYFIKILNLEGKTYAQGISEFVTLDFNSKKGGDLHRKVEKLTNIKIEDGKFISDQIKASFVYLKDKKTMYGKETSSIKLMICSKRDKNGTINCRINDDDNKIIPEEIPGKYPQSSFTRLGIKDLKGKNPKELNLMKKEIYARYGYRFQDKNDANYFFSQDWYEPIVDNKLIELNDLEKDNIAMINLYEGGTQYKDLNKKSYSHIFPLETTSSTLYDKNTLKSVKYIKQDTVKGSKCQYTEYNRKGIAVSQQDCMINNYNYINYFNKDILTEQTTHSKDTYFYYSEDGLPSKSVKVDYKTGNTEEVYYFYDKDESIIKKEIFLNNNYNSTVYYDYDSKGNIKKEYYKDTQGKEEMVTEYFYDEDDIIIGRLENKDMRCDYTYNDLKDVVLKTKCYRIINDREYIRLKWDRDVLETNRVKHNRISSIKLIERENYINSLSIIEAKYY